MKKYSRTIVLLVLTTGCLLVPSIVSTNMADTYIARTNRINEESQATSRFFFALQTEDSLGVGILDSIKLKDPNMALLYAVIPGAVFHGAGHVYAGRIPTAITLFGCELLGLGLASLGAVSQIEGPNDPGDNAIFIGSVIFIGTWLYDLIGSPLAVQKRNRELLDQKPVGLEFRTKDGDARVSVVWRF